MTRAYNEHVQCLNCGHRVASEQPFNSWLRKHPQLDSLRENLTITDSDLWIHQFADRRTRFVGKTKKCFYLMLVEVKTNQRALPESQRDILHMVNQLIRTNPWKEQRLSGQFLASHEQNLRIIHSTFNGVKVPVNCYGVHTLRMDGTTPENSSWLLWDFKPISLLQLVALFQWELHPDSLRQMEHREHKKMIESQPELWDIENS